MQFSEEPQVEIAVVSPHRDDAAFSCGIVMLAALRSRSVRIINLFTHSAYAPFTNAIDERDIEAVTALRREEDMASLHLLRSAASRNAELTEVDLGLLDAPLRLHLAMESVQGHALDTATYELEVHSLAALLDPVLEHAACVLLPLGLGGRTLDGHVDHRIARDAGLRCVASDRIAFYEDLPYAARMPQEDRDMAIRIFTFRLAGVQPLLIKIADAGQRKLTLAQCYSSQVDATTMEEITLYTSERGGERVYAAANARGILETL